MNIRDIKLISTRWGTRPAHFPSSVRKWLDTKCPNSLMGYSFIKSHPLTFSYLKLKNLVQLMSQSRNLKFGQYRNHLYIIFGDEDLISRSSQKLEVSPDIQSKSFLGSLRKSRVGNFFYRKFVGISKKVSRTEVHGLRLSQKLFLNTFHGRM